MLLARLTRKIKQNAWHATLTIVIFFTLLHILIAIFVGDLFDDSTHYALYAQYPNLSYFDHPPLVGWLQLVGIFLGKSNFAMQIMPIVMAAFFNIILYIFVRTLWPLESDWIAFISVLILQLQIVIYGFPIVYTPELPMLCFALTGLLFFYKAWHNNTWKAWVFTGVGFGLIGTDCN